MKLTPQQVGAVWILSGGPREATADAISESYVESNHTTDAISSTGNVGLWQIGPHGDSSLKDPMTNGRAAVAKWRGGGNSFVQAWTNFQAPGTEAKRLAYLPRAKLAASRVTRLNENQLRAVVGGRQVQAGLDLPDIPLPNIFPPIPGIPNPFDSVPDLANPLGELSGLAEFVGNIAELMRGFFELTLEWSKKIVDPETWKDAGKILLGFILLTIGIKRLFTITTG